MSSPDFSYDVPPASPEPQAARSTSVPGMTQNIANGFAEAAQAFSDEVSGSSTCGDLAGSLVTAYFKANARLFDELATSSKQMSNEWLGSRSIAEPDLNRLADMVAVRVMAAQSAGLPVGGIDYERLADLVAAKMATKPDV